MIRGTRRINLQYAVGEIILIFIGITLAIWFNNWNDSQRTRQLELNTLREIKDGLAKDLTDIRLNISGHEARLNSYRELVKAIEKDLPLSDSIEQHVPRLIGYTSFITNRAPYETLKARGVDIIQSDTLRRAILEYYDIRQDWLVFNEQDHIRHNLDHIKPMLLRYADLSQDFSFRDYSGFKNDPLTKQTLAYGSLTDYYILGLYKGIEEHAELTMALIEAEIEN